MGDRLDLEEWGDPRDDGGEAEVNGGASDKDLASRMNMKAEGGKVSQVESERTLIW